MSQTTRTGRSVLPKEQELHHDYTTGDQYSDGEIEQPAQKTTWIQDIQSGILQVRRCISNLNPRKYSAQVFKKIPWRNCIGTGIGFEIVMSGGFGVEYAD
jgi:hypothetical protein